MPATGPVASLSGPAPARRRLLLAAAPLLATPALLHAEPPSRLPEAVHRHLPATVRPGMTLTFAEEFDRFEWSADGRRGWRTRYPFGRTLLTNKEAQYYSDATVGQHPFRILDGALEISAALGENEAGLPYVSGIITSQHRFWQCYGYFEARAWLPRGRGLWPAIWLLPKDGSWPPEIDMVEMLGHRPDQIFVTLHSKVKGEGKHVPVTVADTAAGFHVYSVEWRPELMRFFFDGREIATIPTPSDMHKPMYILANLAVGGPGSWPGPPDAGTQFPARMLIDYIRAWQFDAP
jgi:beta-glucanase (GH16 family)